MPPKRIRSGCESWRGSGSGNGGVQNHRQKEAIMIEYPEFGYLPLWSIPIIGGATDEPPKILSESLRSEIKELVREALREERTMHQDEPQGKDRWLDMEETGNLLGYSKSWLYRHASALPFARKVGAEWRFSEQRIQKWLAGKKLS